MSPETSTEKSIRTSMQSTISSVLTHPITKQRWLTLFAYSLLGLACGLPLAALYTAFLGKVADQFSADFCWLKPLWFWIVSIILFCVVRCQFRSRIVHLRHLWSYPPCFVAVVIAAIAAVVFFEIYQRWWLPLDEQMDCIVLWMLIFGALLILVWLWFSQRKQFQCSWHHCKVPNTQSYKPSELMTMPIQELLVWIEDEKPVRESHYDFLNAKARALRVQAALNKPRKMHDVQGTVQTVVIQGSFGAGKTTIANLIEEAASQNTKDLQIVLNVSCWGFSSSAAREFILERVVEEVSKHADCLSLQRLPPAYAAAIAKTDSWLNAVTESFSVSPKPVEVLKRLSPILEVINARLVIIIEDSDRNADDFDQKQIEAMLHDFRQVNRVSFVLTVGTNSEIEVSKIAEYILTIPPLPPEVSLTVIDQVRNHCRHNWQTIDLTGAIHGRGDLRSEASVFGQMALQSWVIGLAKLIETPRVLKQVCRAYLSAWEHLHGEVDFDELLMVVALRHAAPEIFSFLCVHFNDLLKLKAAPPASREGSQRAGIDHPENMEDERHAAHLKDRWLRAIEALDASQTSAGVAILAELIPATSRITGSSIWRITRTNRAQGIRSKRGHIYWERLVGEMVSEELHDQRVLGPLFEAIKRNSVERLAKSFQDSAEFSKMLIFFEGYYPRLDCDLALALARAVLEGLRQAVPSMQPAEFPVLNDLADWIGVHHVPRELLAGWVKQQIADCFPFHLHLANSIYRCLVKDVFPPTEEKECREVLVESAKTHYAGMDADTFVSCFNKAYAFSLVELLFLDDPRYIRADGWHANPEEWSCLARVLLEAVEKHPDVLKPQMIFAFGRYLDRGRLSAPFQFSTEVVEGVFGDKSAQVYALLAEPFTSAPMEPSDLARIQEAQAAAARLYSEKTKRLWATKTVQVSGGMLSP